jgi:hypothetical protein
MLNFTTSLPLRPKWTFTADMTFGFVPLPATRTAASATVQTLAPNPDPPINTAVLWLGNTSFQVFIFLFLFRYVRATINSVASRLYRPTPIPENPHYTADDVTVVIPTTDISTPTLHKVLRSILAHNVARLIITTTQDAHSLQLPALEAAIPAFRPDIAFRDSDTHCLVKRQPKPNYRRQVAAAMEAVDTKILIIPDDHTYWPSSPTFIPALLAPFEDPKIGAVGPAILGKHHHHSLSFRGFWNFIGMVYLLRNHMQDRATNTVDGGLSCLTGRFGVYRSSIWKDTAFLRACLNEYISFFGLYKVGPLTVDDDKFHTRWLVNHGWNIRVQGGPETTLLTELGVWPRFHAQILRWTRTSWRTVPRTLAVDRTCWTRFPYTKYAMYVYSIVRMSLFYEGAMFYSLWKAMREIGCADDFPTAAWGLVGWIAVTRVFKVWPHLREYPGDVVYVPGYTVFLYWNSLIRLYAFFTMWKTYWDTESKSGKGSGKSTDREEPQNDNIVWAGKGPGGVGRVLMASGRSLEAEG